MTPTTITNTMRDTSQAVADSPLFSVIIATYNRGYIVCEAIDSVLDQTYRHTEVIVVDDGSTDDTQEKLKRYGTRIRVVSQANSGPAAAWNAGIKAASGAIISFLGSDDLYLPNFAERHVSALQKAGPAVPCSLCNAISRFADGKETTSFEHARLRPRLEEGLWKNPLDVFLTRFVMCGQTLAVRRDVLHKTGLFDPTLRYLEDYDMAVRLALDRPWAFISEPLVLYRQSKGDSLSLSISPDDPKLHRYMLKIRDRIATLMISRDPLVQSRYLRASLSEAKGDVWASELQSKSSRFFQYLGAAYKLLKHYYVALVSRSPFYPQMDVTHYASPGNLEQMDALLIHHA